MLEGVPTRRAMRILNQRPSPSWLNVLLWEAMILDALLEGVGYAHIDRHPMNRDFQGLRYLDFVTPL